MGLFDQLGQAAAGMMGGSNKIPYCKPRSPC